MAYALVGSMGTTAGPSTSTVSPTFAQSTTAGNLLIAWLFDNATFPDANTPAGWTLVQAGVFVSPSPCIFYKANCGAGETAPSFTHTSSTLYARLAEFSGGATSSPLDQSGTGGVSGTSPATVNCGSTDSASAELVIYMQSDNLSKAATTTTSWTLNNGAVATNSDNNDSASVSTHYRMAWATTTGNSAADQIIAADNSMNINDLHATLASFKLASTTATIPRNPAINFQDPAVLMRRLADSWRNRRHSGILVPDLWLPGMAG